MQSNTSNQKLNENPWMLMTELRLGNRDEAPDDGKSTSSSESSEQRTPPFSTPFGLFGENDPALKAVLYSGHYKLSPPSFSIDCSSSQHIPRSFNPPHLEFDTQRLRPNDLQLDSKPILHKLLSDHDSIEEPSRDDLVRNQSQLIFCREDPETIQSKRPTNNLKSKKMKRYQMQGTEAEKQVTKNQQNESETENTSNSEHRQMKLPETDEESISDLDSTESNSKNSS